jgi:hypothetical protein
VIGDISDRNATVAPKWTQSDFDLVRRVEAAAAQAAAAAASAGKAAAAAQAAVRQIPALSPNDPVYNPAIHGRSGRGHGGYFPMY